MIQSFLDYSHEDAPVLCPDPDFSFSQQPRLRVIAPPQRVPCRHEQVHHYSKHVPRHALALGPASHLKKKYERGTELATLLSLDGEPPR